MKNPSFKAPIFSGMVVRNIAGERPAQVEYEIFIYTGLSQDQEDAIRASSSEALVFRDVDYQSACVLVPLSSPFALST